MSNMLTKTGIVVTALFLAFGVADLAAHHSAAEFDFSQPVQIEGIIKSIRVINPHTRIFLEVTDAKGTREIEFEGHSRNNFYRAGWRPEKGMVGEKLTVTIAPRRDGGDGGYITAFVTASGDRIGFRAEDR